jgi:radical SAM protein with 4Fe4S-binding SPASM domain
MFDIDFYMNAAEFKKHLGQKSRQDRESVFKKLEEYRSPMPVVYNIETTNACNMRCAMCPRTTMMTRPVENLDLETFRRVIDQIEPWSAAKLGQWEAFVQDYYGIGPGDMSENHFFLYIIPKVLVLHGYGDPLLDKWMPERVRLLTARQIPSYFSCNPANINIEKMLEMFDNGLGYVKYSIESVDDTRHKEIRGSASNFTQSYEKIVNLLEIKKKYHYQTTVVITMLNLDKSGEEEYRKLLKAFADLEVYIYLKSIDQQWYGDRKMTTNSIHWLEFCQFPWSSMTIKSNGEAAMCVEDFNNEIILGDAKQESLAEIWNGERYRKLRRDHFQLTRGLKCTEQCDMTLIGSLVC